MHKKQRHYCYFFLPFALVDLLLFLNSYRDLDLFPEFVPFPLWSFVAALFVVIYYRKNLKAHAVPIFATLLVNIVISGALIFSTMFLPGSLEHNHVMYDVCFPAMKKYYTVPEDGTLPAGPTDAHGMGKWWYQHSECEQNVKAGKGPLFSENPPGFLLMK